ncbi:MAG TPA: Ig-like domain-containing protein, partial [Thermoanaerobaculia bacterium]
VRAERYQFLLQHPLEELQDGTVCFFSGDPGSFAEQYFVSNEVQCAPAGKLITLLPGAWNIYAVHERGFVSTHPDFFIVPPGLPPENVERKPVSMIAAGSADMRELNASLRPGEHVVLYIANDGRPRSLATARPVPMGDEIVFVPAAMTLVPLAILDGRVTAVGDPLTVAAGELVRVSPLERDRLGTTVVAEVTVESSWLEHLRALRQVPEIVLETSDGSLLRPMLPLRAATGWVKSLLFFRDVPRGTALLRVSGTMWQEVEASIDVGVQQAQLLAPPLELSPGGAVTAEWHTIETGAFGPAIQRNSCAEEPTIPHIENEAQGQPRKNAIRLIRCESWPAEASTDCSVFTTVEIDGDAGVQTIGGVAPGRYRLEVDHSGNVLAEDVEVEALRESREAFAFKRMVLRGRVTRAEKPVSAEIRFGGAGRAVSDPASGEYHALITGKARAPVVTVTPCGEPRRAFRLLGPESDLVTTFDIELPANRLQVRVLDAVSGEAVPNATVMISIGSSETDAGDAYSETYVTDADGTAVAEDVSHLGHLSVCADQVGYVRGCAEQFRVTATEKKDLSIALSRITAREGRLLVPARADAARVNFVVPPGRMIASARVKPDGTFTYELPSVIAPVYVVVFGRNVPLLAVPYVEPREGEPFTIDARRASRVITVTKQSGSAVVPFTLMIDGMTLPRFVLDQHQLMRNRESRIAPGAPLLVPDVAGGSIQVIVGPEVLPPDFVTGDLYNDIFNTEPFAQTLQRVAVGPDGIALIR